MKRASRKKITTVPKTSTLKIAIGASCFNQALVDRELASCHTHLQALGVRTIEVARVPGALELPILLACFAAEKRFDALIALGCVIRGDTYHFEVVSQQSAQGLMLVQLQYRQPTINGVLTTYTVAQARSRVVSKGKESAQAAVDMALLLRNYV